MEKINGKQAVTEVFSSPGKLRTAIVSLLAMKGMCEAQKQDLMSLLTDMRGRDDVPEDINHRVQKFLTKE